MPNSTKLLFAIGLVHGLHFIFVVLNERFGHYVTSRIGTRNQNKVAFHELCQIASNYREINSPGLHEKIDKAVRRQLKIV